ncbi:MAG: Gfo/Idh/MocA family oxidoreductase [Sphaerochaetaceae bacterium]
MNEVKVLLVGIGGYGDNYIKEFLEKDIDAVTLVGICDPFASQSPRYSEIIERKIPSFASVEEFFASNRADLAVIASPIHTHLGYIQSCLEHKCNVLCEKPPFMALSEFQRLEALERESGCFVGIGYQQCYSRDVLALKKDILSGRYGKPVALKALRMMRRGSAYYSRNSWAGKIQCRGIDVFDSPLSNACAHEIQNMLFVLGKELGLTTSIATLQAKCYKANPTIENFDAVALQAVTTEGVPLNYYTAHCIPSTKVGPFACYEFEKGTIVLGSEGNGFVASAKDGSLIRDYSLVNKGDRLQKLYDCISCVRERNRPVCTLVTSYEHISLVNRVQAVPVLGLDDSQVEVIKNESETFFVAKGLQELFCSCYEKAQLPQ